MRRRALARLARRVRSLAARGRRLGDGLRGPGATLFRWVRVGPGDAVALDRHGRGIDGQPAHRVVLGRDVTVGDHVDVHLGPWGRVEIGDDVVLGPHVQIAADRLVRIGSGCRIGDHGVLVDTWTYGREPLDVPAPPPEPVTIGAGARLGARTVVGPGVTVAPGAELAPGTLRHPGLEAPT